MEKISFKASESPYRFEQSLTTGLPKLDTIIGVGGIPTGRITCLVGNKSTGKTTLALTIIAHQQKLGKRCVFIDAENALYFKRAEELGVDLEKLIIVHADFGERYLDEVQRLVDEKEADLIIVDSVAALSPRTEQEGSNEQMQIGAHARMFSKFLRKVILPLRKNNVALVLLNHVTLDIMTGQEKSPGGKALEYYASLVVHMKLHAQSALKQGDKQVGNKYILRIKKNKVGPPFRECVVTLLYDSGYSREADLLEEMLLDGRIKKSGRTYFLNDEKIAVGEPAAREYLKTYAG